jgi:hypothetical protein
VTERDMTEQPVVCDNCGTISRTRAVASGPGDPLKCPVCGEPMRSFATGDVLERVALEVLWRPGRRVEDLRTYKEVLDNLRGALDDNELSPEEAPERLRREAPELAKLADVLPKTRAELYAALGLILSAIALFLNIDQENKPSRSVFDPGPKTLSRRGMRRRIRRAAAVRKEADGQLVLLRFVRGGLTKTEEWAALHSHYVRPDGGYHLVREKVRRA